MGYAVPINGNVLHLRDFSCITREDIEECQSLMPKYYSVVVSDTPEVKCTKIDNSVFYDNARLQAISMIDTSITQIGILLNATVVHPRVVHFRILILLCLMSISFTVCVGKKPLLQ